MGGILALHFSLFTLTFFLGCSAFQIATAVEIGSETEEMVYEDYIQALLNTYAEIAKAYWTRFTIMTEVLFHLDRNILVLFGFGTDVLLLLLRQNTQGQR